MCCIFALFGLRNDNCQDCFQDVLLASFRSFMLYILYLPESKHSLSYSEEIKGALERVGGEGKLVPNLFPDGTHSFFGVKLDGYI